MHISEQAFITGLSVSRRPISERVFLAQSGLRWPVCALLTQLAAAPPGALILDATCGRGTIAVAAAQLLPGAFVLAVDCCPDAIASCCANITALRQHQAETLVRRGARPRGADSRTDPLSADSGDEVHDQESVNPGDATSGASKRARTGAARRCKEPEHAVTSDPEAGPEIEPHAHTSPHAPSMTAAPPATHASAGIAPVLADCRCLPFRAGLFDAVITDLPFGRNHTVDEALGQFYIDTLEELARVVRLGGRAVLLVNQLLLVKSALRDQWVLQQTHAVSLGKTQGHAALLLRIVRPDTALTDQTTVCL
jgi:23S rRNA G2445 N2-methylase RlmL